jgi:hypothetical protein
VVYYRQQFSVIFVSPTDRHNYAYFTVTFAQYSNLGVPMTYIYIFFIYLKDKVIYGTISGQSVSLQCNGVLYAFNDVPKASTSNFRAGL